MIPAQQTPSTAAGPVDFQPSQPAGMSRAVAGMPLALGAQAEELGVGALLRFKSMLAAEGQTLQLSRLCYDRLYAYERIATAHASSNPELQRLALELFQIYHRRASAGFTAQ